MNEIVNKILLAADKFMLEIHLRLLVFTYSVYTPFNKQKEKYKKIKKQKAQNVSKMN